MRRAAIALVVLVACKHDKLTTGFSERVEPPGGLRFGMTADEAHKALPALSADPQPRAQINAKVVLLVTFANNKLSEASAFFDVRSLDQASAVDAFKPLWGAPDPVHSTDPTVELEWKNVATGWRADLRCLPDGTCQDLRFLPYRPLTEAYFGSRCAPPKALAALQLGMTVDAARKALPELPEPQPLGDGRSIAHVDGGADGTLGDIWFDKNAVFALSVSLPLASTAEPLVNHAWGPGKVEHDDRGKPITVWTDSTWHCELAHQEVHEGNAVVDAAELTFTRATP